MSDVKFEVSKDCPSDHIRKPHYSWLLIDPVDDNISHDFSDHTQIFGGI